MWVSFRSGDPLNIKLHKIPANELRQTGPFWFLSPLAEVSAGLAGARLGAAGGGAGLAGRGRGLGPGARGPRPLTASRRVLPHQLLPLPPRRRQGIVVLPPLPGLHRLQRLGGLHTWPAGGAGQPVQTFQKLNLTCSLVWQFWLSSPQFPAWRGPSCGFSSPAGIVHFSRGLDKTWPTVPGVR